MYTPARFFCFLVLSLFLLGRAWAGMPVLTLGAADTIDLNSHVEVLEDKSGKLTLPDVLLANNRFSSFRAEGKYWDKGLTRSAFWFRVKVRNASTKVDWHTHLRGSLSRSVTVYIANDDTAVAADFRKLQLVPNAHDINYYFRLPLGSERILYYRIQDKQAPLVIKVQLSATSDLVGYFKQILPQMSLVAGGLFMLAIYNFLYFLHLRDKSFLILSLLILTFMLGMGGHVGLWNNFGWMRNHHVVGEMFSMLAVACGIVLFRQWLDMPKNLPLINRLWCYSFWVSCGLALICPFISFGAALVTGLSLIMFLLLAVSLFLFYRLGLRLPLSMLLAGAIFTIALTPALLRSIEVIEASKFIPQAAILGLLVSLMLLSLWQAGNMRSKNELAERTRAANQARDEFLTTMSHELRTPMNSIVSAGQLLNLSSLAKDQTEYVSRLNTSSKHMLSLINDILDLARLDQQNIHLESTPFQLKAILQQTEQLLEEQIKSKSIRLVIDNRFHSLRKQLLGDPVRLQQILLNLLNNAIKFTEQGEVRLTITPQAVDNNSAMLLFEIRDTGIGIIKERQAELFQPFTQADTSTSRIYGGSGLGLAISNKLISRMGGELQLESEPERGSCFFFILSLPLNDETSEKNRTFLTHNTTTAVTNLRVLLVDDDEMNRFFNSRLLVSLGVKVTTVASGEQALCCLQQHTFDLVFIDVSMPDMDGYETTRNIRINLKNQKIIVIALTAHAISGERERCLAAGMDDYLPKPFTRKELEDMLHQYGLLKPLVSFK